MYIVMVVLKQRQRERGRNDRWERQKREGEIMDGRKREEGKRDNG